MGNGRLVDLVGRFPGRRVLVVGDVMLDEYIWGDVSRVSPEAPIPIVEIAKEFGRAGGAANVLANVWSLASSGSIVGVIGDDEPGRELARLLRGLGIDTGGLVVDGERPTTLKRRIVARSQQMLRVDRESRKPVDGGVCERLRAQVRERLSQADAVVLSDYAKGVVTPEIARVVVDMAKSAGKPVVVDPKTSHLDRYRDATVITPNTHEVEDSLKVHITDEAMLEEVGRKILMELSLRAVIITRGEMGMSLIDREGARHIPTVAREVYDVTGAGDTVAATLALALAAGGSMLEAALVANHAAGIVVGKIGTATVGLDELLKDLGGTVQ